MTEQVTKIIFNFGDIYAHEDGWYDNFEADMFMEETGERIILSKSDVINKKVFHLKTPLTQCSKLFGGKSGIYTYSRYRCTNKSYPVSMFLDRLEDTVTISFTGYGSEYGVGVSQT